MTMTYSEEQLKKIRERSINEIRERADCLDAAIFTGDTFHNHKIRREMIRNCERWIKGLKEFKE